MYERFVLLDSATLRRAEEEVRRCRRKKKQRPTALAVVEHRHTGKFLVIYSSAHQSAADEMQNPGFPKGGINEWEHVLIAVLREIEEEVGISAARAAVVGYGGSCGVESIKRRGGFRKKRYFVFRVLVDTDRVNLNLVEVGGHRWCDLEEMKTILEPLRAQRSSKLQALLRIVDMLEREPRVSTVEDRL